jgi:hypothetical protein
MKTKIEIIDETVAFYEADPSRRAHSLPGGCTYRDFATGNKCAVGRCLTPEGIALIEDVGGNNMNMTELRDEFDINFEDHLEEEYQGHPITFWEDLQNFHDLQGYWRVGVEGPLEASNQARRSFVSSLREKWAPQP